MDTWTREMVEQMRKVGNVRGNAEWNPDEGRNPVPVSTEGWKDREGEMEKFIRRKYEQGAFRADAVVTVHAPNRTTRAEPPRSYNVPPRKHSSAAASNLDPYTSNPLLIPTQDYPPSNGDGRQVDTYPMAGPSSSGKRTATRAHVDANWADLMSFAPASSSGKTGKKAGRLLGMHEADDEQYLGTLNPRDRDDGTGGIRLPPVTKAPKGLSYKSDTPSKATPPPPPPPTSETPRSNGMGNAKDTSDKGPQNPTPLINVGTSERTEAQQTPSGIMSNMHMHHNNGPAIATATATGMPGNPFNPFMNQLYAQPQYQQAHQQQQQYQHLQQQQQQGYPSTVGTGYPAQASIVGSSMPGMGPGPGVAMMGIGMGMGMGVGPGTPASSMPYPNVYPYPPPNQISPFILAGTTGGTPNSPFAPVQHVGGGMGGAGYFGGQPAVVGHGQMQTQESGQGQQQGMMHGAMMGWGR
ncbi:hypothetical protein QFC19_003326 [Naganishia cerealis]|uniref:Uncharacterized protein n=1 Tax=Naganishia cerealis TaxID=610337 RepID=A0ACC2W4H8_9TREE|nr:hypothetical protein QFC19_003326 [Naganishia cerealis]